MIHTASFSLYFFVQAVTNSFCADDSTRVTWSPTAPTEGSVIQIIVEPASDLLENISIHSEIAEQALHFEVDDAGCYRALAPIPVDTPDTLVVALRIVGEDGAVELVSTRIPVGRVHSGVLELSVDPRYIAPPDSVISRIQAERTLVGRVSRGSHNTPLLWNKSFLRPRSTRITSGFGQRREFNGELRSRHLGVDLAGATGEPVLASNRGVVVIVHDFYYAGNAIHIDHGNGLTTAYMHLSQVSVAVGDTVARGETIGHVGATGRVTGPHLHWHAKYGLVTVNPLTLLEIPAAEVTEH